MQINAQGNRELFFVDVDLTEIQSAYSELIEAKEEAEAASRAKSLFLANMSHELRTPLNGIMGVHHILESTSLDDKQQEYLSLAQGSAMRLTTLLNDILDLTRVEAGCMELKNTSFSLAETLHDTKQLFQASSGQEDVEFRFHVDPEIPKKLVGDHSRLQQILNNIVGNAIKFTAVGKIEISVSLLPNRSGDECKLLFSISDTGIGIPEDKLDSIFNSFTQVDDSFTRTHQGAGLGLSIVKRLVGLMGGNMAVESRIGMGTTFYLCLPFQVETKTTAIEIPASQHGLQVSPGRIKALLVEDDVISQMVFQKLLEKEGCEVITANDGIQAIQKLNRQRFDVVFMDVQMPVMDGVTATQAIRNGEAGEQSMNTMLIATTAYAMTGDKEMLLQAGMDGYIEKPIAMGALQQVLNRIRHTM